MTLQVQIITLFPDMFPGPLGCAIYGKALKKGLWTLQTIDLRQFAPNGRVDDTPYGGGAGMVIRPDVIDGAMQISHEPYIYLTPRGKKFTQQYAQQLAKLNNMTLLCGHYEGIDERICNKYSLLEISVGDFVLSGGEIAAFVILDTILRLRKGIIGNPDSLLEESFENNSLEYPQYTKPALWENYAVPSVLLSGNHQKIKTWRKEQAERLTQQKRPDILKKLDY